MSQRNRGSEITAQVLVDGDLKGGSWTKVLDFELSPKQDVSETGFLGELEDDHDFQHMGYDFNFTCQEIDQKLRDVMLDLVAREQARAEYPSVMIVLTIKHRAGTPQEVIVLENCVMKFDSLSFSNKKDYVTTKLSGKCKTVSRQ